MKAAKPELETILLEAGGEQLLSRVANMMADYMGATKKFVDFIMEFLPDPPAKRPPEIFQISWKREEMVKSLRKIYDWRSRALHGGIPFPAPMCMAPGRHDNAPNEIIIGLATSTRGAVWVKEDTPMLLHVFEHIVRNALLNWWRQMVPERSKIDVE